MPVEKRNSVGFLLSCLHGHDGVASHCETLIRGLMKSGWKIVLFTGPVRWESGSQHRVDAIRAMVDEWVVFEDLNPIFPSISSVLQVRQKIEEHSLALLHVHGYKMLVFAFILRVIAGLRCVATFHPSITIYDPKMASGGMGNKTRTKDWRYRAFLRISHPHGYIAYSSEIEHWLIDNLQISKELVAKIVLGIDIGYFRPPSADERTRARANLGVIEGSLVCALVGRLGWDKGPDILIDAVRKLRSSYPEVPVKGMFVGSGGGEEDIKKYAHSSDADSHSFLFAGHVRELREAYWAADILVLPSRVEGFALVVAEAMCCGVPPIRTPSGGASDQIEHGKTGYIVPFEDAGALAEAIIKLADKHLRLEMAHRCAEFASEAFDERVMVKKTVTAYERCIRGAMVGDAQDVR